jgi:hypothetical protein
MDFCAANREEVLKTVEKDRELHSLVAIAADLVTAPTCMKTRGKPGG